MSEQVEPESPREVLGRQVGRVLEEQRALKLRESRPDFVRRILQKVAGGTPLNELQLERKVLSAYGIGDAYTNFVPYIAANDIVELETQDGRRLVFGVLTSGKEMSERAGETASRGLKVLVVRDSRVEEARFRGSRSPEGYLDYGFLGGR